MPPGCIVVSTTRSEEGSSFHSECASPERGEVRGDGCICICMCVCSTQIHSRFCFVLCAPPYVCVPPTPHTRARSVHTNTPAALTRPEHHALARTGRPRAARMSHPVAQPPLAHYQRLLLVGVQVAALRAWLACRGGVGCMVPVCGAEEGGGERVGSACQPRGRGGGE